VRNLSLLSRRKAEASFLSIDKLFLSNCIVCILCYPPVLVYYAARCLAYQK
jgi:hypothetical protein